jgi:hypothetical protein
MYTVAEFKQHLAYVVPKFLVQLDACSEAKDVTLWKTNICEHINYRVEGEIDNND